jgi:hypothetical protein
MPLWLLPALKSRWLHMGLLALACALLWVRGSHYRDDRDQWKLAFNNQKAAYVAAQEAAKAKAIAAKLAVEAAYSAKAKEADHVYQTALDRAKRASDAYVARMRTQGARGASGGTAAPAQSDGPESPDRPGSDAELVAVTRDDLEIMVENSVRLKAAHDWATTLNVGRAPDPAFGR